MSYSEYKLYVMNKYPDDMKEDITFLFESLETIYMNKTSPFDLSAEFDENNKRATNWVTRAVIKIIENGEFDITSYSENNLAISLGDSMMSELTPRAGVPK